VSGSRGCQALRDVRRRRQQPVIIRINAVSVYQLGQEQEIAKALRDPCGFVQQRDLLEARVKITSHSHHRSFLFFRALVLRSCQVYSGEVADNLI
jgi:hypothetical protein